jgi:hypothetical protein
MAIERKIPEQQHTNGAIFLIAAVLTALITISSSLLFLFSGFLVSGFILASGAVIIGLLARQVAGEREMWQCFGLGALALIAGALLQFMVAAVA